MICDGCLVEGFYPHHCELWVPREGRDPHPCYCDVERGCARWPGTRHFASNEGLSA